MAVEDQIKHYLDSHAEPKRTEMHVLHDLALQTIPGCKLWFSDGKNSEGKVVSNPNVGYGSYTIQYADGTSRQFFQIGLSANTSGISIYIMGLPDKALLKNSFGASIGKASVSSYCIKFKTIKDIDLDVLQEAIRTGIQANA